LQQSAEIRSAWQRRWFGRFAGSGGDDHRVGPTSPLTIGSLADLLKRAAPRKSDWVRMKADFLSPLRGGAGISSSLRTCVSSSRDAPRPVLEWPGSGRYRRERSSPSTSSCLMNRNQMIYVLAATSANTTAPVAKSAHNSICISVPSV